jgi:hypothetical protein
MMGPFDKLAGSRLSMAELTLVLWRIVLNFLATIGLAWK